jgi:UDP-N-acetylmuramate dehydrogenase
VSGVKLSDYTTLGLGGFARNFVAPTSEQALQQELAQLDRLGEPVLLLGGGSNVVVSDAPYAGTVVYLGAGLSHCDISMDGADVVVRAGAGLSWDLLVERATLAGAVGLECMSGIPGLVGGAPIQNIGAYGQEVVDTLEWVRVLDRETQTFETVGASACGLSYRYSRFKGLARHVVVEVQFRCSFGAEAIPPAYTELTRALHARQCLSEDGRASLTHLRETVLSLRAQKGMVLSQADPDSRSAGSFFTNPVVSAEQLAFVRTMILKRLGAVNVPEYPASDGRTKLAAGWLIEHAGFRKGMRHKGVGISTKHALALVNVEHGTSAELVELAQRIRDGVKDAFGVSLMPEPVFVGHAWT